MKLRNDKILVFGGGSGIGKAIAKRFCDAGAKIVIAGRHEDKLKSAAEEINSENTYYKVFDIANVNDHTSFFYECSKVLGGVSGFVNAAALGSAVLTGRGFDPWDITEDEWDALNDVNYKAAFFLIRNEADYFKKEKIGGNILNIASNAVCKEIVGSYGAAKLAVIKWTRAFGRRCGNGIVINGIAPGATFTQMISRYAHSIDQPFEKHAIGRFIRPDEIAELAYYLMSDYGEIVCGHTVIADGGDREAIL